MIAKSRPNVSSSGTWRMGMWAAFALLLVAPLVAMRFTDEVAWNSSDFSAAAILLVGVGSAVELSLRLTRRTAIRSVLIGAIVATGLTIWADGAVGLI